MPDSEYIALKPMKVQELMPDGSPKLGEDGRPVLRKCGPGDPIPEATGWPNLHREVRAGRVGLSGTALTGPALADSMRRMINHGRATRASAERAAEANREKTTEPQPRRRRRAQPAEPDPMQEVADVAPRAPGEDPDQE